MGAYMAWLEASLGLRFATYDEAWRWSVDDPGAFWTSVWRYFEVEANGAIGADATPEGALADPAMPGARWFPGTTLNYAEHALRLPGRRAGRRRGRRPVPDPRAARADRRRAARPGRPRAGRACDARRAAGRSRGGLPAERPRGDRRLPRDGEPRARSGRRAPPSSASARSSTASARSSRRSCSPIDGYRYGDQGRRPRGRAGRDPGRPADASSTTVVLPYLDRARAAGPRRARVGRAAGATPGRWPSTRSRSTTRCTSCTRRGRPACPSRSCTATAASCWSTSRRSALHHDLGPADRFCWFTTTGWMMWNYLVSGLLVGSDRRPLRRRPGASRTCDAVAAGRPRPRTTYLGAQRAVPDGLPQGGPAPGRDLDLSRAAGRRLDRRAAARRRLPLGPRRGRRPRSTSARSAAGPTSAPASSARARSCRSGRARSRCRMLGARVEAFDADGAPLVGRAGRAGDHRADAVDAGRASGATTTARATGRPTSSRTRASGGTATG